MELPGNPVGRRRRGTFRRRWRHHHAVRLHGHAGTRTEPTPSTCAGIPSTIDPNSIGSPPYAPPCDWCPHRTAGPRGHRATSAIDAIDHVMTYFFTDRSGLKGFIELSTALGDADRKLPLLPPVERGVYTVQQKTAARRVKIGADVLPWWPVKGVYLLLETNGDAAAGPARRRRRRGQCGRRLPCRAMPKMASAPAGQTHHVLLSRRRPGRCRQTAASGT